MSTHVSPMGPHPYHGYACSSMGWPILFPPRLAWCGPGMYIHSHFLSLVAATIVYVLVCRSAVYAAPCLLCGVLRDYKGCASFAERKQANTMWKEVTF